MFKKAGIETVLNVIGNVMIVGGTILTTIATGRKSGKGIAEALAKASSKTN